MRQAQEVPEHKANRLNSKMAPYCQRACCDAHSKRARKGASALWTGLVEHDSQANWMRFYVLSLPQPLLSLYSIWVHVSGKLET